MALAKTRRYACIVALGCVIRGETPHFDFVAGEAARGLQLAALETGVPVAFGVLTLEQAEQAEARLEKGAEAVRSGARDGRRLRPAPRRAQRQPSSAATAATSAGRVQGLRILRQEAVVREQPEPLDGGDPPRFNPNLQSVRVLLNGVAKRAYICTRCLKAGKVQKASARLTAARRRPAPPRLARSRSIPEFQPRASTCEQASTSPVHRPAKLGAIRIAADAIAQIVGHTAAECYGVVGMAGKGLKRLLDARPAHTGDRRLGPRRRPPDRPPRRRRVRAQPRRGRGDRPLAGRLRGRAADGAQGRRRRGAHRRRAEIRMTAA